MHAARTDLAGVSTTLAEVEEGLRVTIADRDKIISERDAARADLANAKLACDESRSKWVAAERRAEAAEAKQTHLAKRFANACAGIVEQRNRAESAENRVSELERLNTPSLQRRRAEIAEARVNKLEAKVADLKENTQRWKDRAEEAEAAVPMLQGDIECLQQRERELEAERDQLRRALTRAEEGLRRERVLNTEAVRQCSEAKEAMRSCVRALRNGSDMHHEASHDFYLLAPKEVALYCRRIEQERDAARAECDQLRADLVNAKLACEGQ